MITFLATNRRTAPLVLRMSKQPAQGLFCAAHTGKRPPVAALAQLVEHIIRNDGVTCSSHVSGTILLHKCLAATICKFFGTNCTRHICVKAMFLVEHSDAHVRKKCQNLE